MSGDTGERQTGGQQAAALSNMMVALLRKYTGRGPTKARTTLGHDHVLIALQDTLTTGERALVAGGYSDRVLDTRRCVQELMRDEAVEGVERTTGRTVIGFMSDNHIDPDMGVEIFLLDPRSDGHRELAEGEATQE